MVALAFVWLVGFWGVLWRCVLFVLVGSLITFVGLGFLLSRFVCRGCGVGLLLLV